MSKYRSNFIVWKCDECGNEHSQLIPLVISEEDWQRTQKMHGKMILDVV